MFVKRLLRFVGGPEVPLISHYYVVGVWECRIIVCVNVATEMVRVPVGDDNRIDILRRDFLVRQVLNEFSGGFCQVSRSRIHQY